MHGHMPMRATQRALPPAYSGGTALSARARRPQEYCFAVCGLGANRAKRFGLTPTICCALTVARRA